MNILHILTKPAVIGIATLLGSVVLAAAPKDDRIAGPPGGPWRRQFLDATVVERQQGLERVFHAARKYPGNPVIEADRPWEKGPHSGGPYLYGTVMWDGGKLRMWYHAHCNGYKNMYAESTDGIHWSKPNLGIVPFNGSTDNNIVVGNCLNPDEDPPFKGQGICHNPSVIKRPWVSDPAKRYVLFCYGQNYRHARAAFSPDGLHWTFVSETRKKGLFQSSDVLNFFYDPYRNRYVATLKTGSRRGRAVGVAVSPDGLNWTKPVNGPVFVADDLDPDATQIYGMPAFPYQGLYIGLPWVYNARWFKYGSYTDQRLYEAEKDSPCTMDVQLSWSWDLVNWTRPPKRTPFIPRGGKGEFDSGMIYTARKPVEVDGKLYFYYGGWIGEHNTGTAHANIGLAILRLDGFCSMHAGNREGWLISRRELFDTPTVTINAKTAPNGYVVAEILDTENKPIPGFTHSDCAPFTGDSTKHVLRWKTRTLPKANLDSDKKFRFFMKNADLFSYLPPLAAGPKKVTYVPGENGGLLPDAKSIRRSHRFTLAGRRTGFRIVRSDKLTYLDMHSAAAQKTTACCRKDADWNDDTDWCVESWYRVVDVGTEPNYGLATFMRPNSGRNAAIYISDKAVGINSTEHGVHRTLATVPMDTADRFHWYRLVHADGANGTLTLFVDGKEVICMPFAKLLVGHVHGGNVVFGPNAAHCEGRIHVAKFGYRLGNTEPLFGPTPGKPE